MFRLGIGLLSVIAVSLAEAPPKLLPGGVEVERAAASNPEAFAAASESDQVGLKVEMQVQRDRAPFSPISLHDPICEGDLVAFTLTPSEPTHVTILNYDSAGVVTQLHPATCGDEDGPGCEGSALVTPDAPLRLPSARGWEVDGRVGKEAIIVYLSDAPLSASARADIKRLLSATSGATKSSGSRGDPSTDPKDDDEDKPPPRPPPPPPDPDPGGNDPRTQTTGPFGRGPVQWVSGTKGETATYMVVPRDQGIAFALDHRRRCDSTP